MSTDWQVLSFYWLYGQPPVDCTCSLSKPSAAIDSPELVHACACSCLLHLLKFPSPCCLVFSNECEAPKIRTIFTLTHMPWVSCRNWPSHHHISFFSPFCFFTWLPPKSIFSTLFLKNSLLLFVSSHGSLPRVHSPPYLWRTLMKLRDALNFFTGMVFVIMSARFFFVMIFTMSITFFTMTQWCILWYLTSMCLICLWFCDSQRDVSHSVWRSRPELNPIWCQMYRPIFLATRLL